MKTKLKEITDSTVNELLCNEIILPSSYFQCFDKYAKTINIDTESKDFEKDLNELVLEEYNAINSYVNSVIKKIDIVTGLTKEAQTAIKNNNSILLTNLYNEIGTLKKELEDITHSVYKDTLTKIYNKKWLYHKYLNEDIKFKQKAIIVYIDVIDFDYIATTYGKLISNNLLIYISKYLNNKLHEEGLNFEICRYLPNKFIIAMNESDLVEIETIISTISRVLSGTTLKSNSGIIIKPTFEYSIIKVKEDENFHETLDVLIKNTHSHN